MVVPARALGPMNYLVLCAVEMVEVFIAARRWKRLTVHYCVGPGGRISFVNVEGDVFAALILNFIF